MEWTSLRNSQLFIPLIFKQRLCILFCFPAKDIIKRNPALDEKLHQVNSRTSSNSKMPWGNDEHCNFCYINSYYEEVDHLQKHSQHLIKCTLIKKYAKTKIRGKIVQLVVKGWNFFPLPLIFINTAYNKVKFKVKPKAITHLFFSAGHGERKEYFWGRSTFRIYYYTILI